MGIFWDLIQQSQISDQRSRSDTNEERITRLEEELYDVRKLLHKLVQTLETHFGEDIDGGGRVG